MIDTAYIFEHTVYIVEGQGDISVFRMFDTKEEAFDFIIKRFNKSIRFTDNEKSKLICRCKFWIGNIIMNK